MNGEREKLDEMIGRCLDEGKCWIIPDYWIFKQRKWGSGCTTSDPHA
jgi:hypothetical protein